MCIRDSTKGLEAVDYTLYRIAEEVLHTTDMSAAGSITVGMLMPMIEFRRQHVEAMDLLSHNPSVEEVAPEEPLEASGHDETVAWEDQFLKAWDEAWPFMKMVYGMVGPVTVPEQVFRSMYGPYCRNIIEHLRDTAGQLEARLYTKYDSLEAEPMSMGKPGSGGVSEMENAMGHTNS